MNAFTHIKEFPRRDFRDQTEIKPIQFAIPIYRGEITGNIYPGPTYIALSPYGTLDMHELMYAFMFGNIQVLRFGNGTDESDIVFDYSNNLMTRTECEDPNNSAVFCLGYGFYPFHLRNKTMGRYLTQVANVSKSGNADMVAVMKHIQSEFGYEPGTVVCESSKIAGYVFQHAGELYSESHKLHLRTIDDLNKQWCSGHYPLTIEA